MLQVVSSASGTVLWDWHQLSYPASRISLKPTLGPARHVRSRGEGDLRSINRIQPFATVLVGNLKHVVQPIDQRKLRTSFEQSQIASRNAARVFSGCVSLAPR